MTTTKNTKIRAWGTGAAFGRELGLKAYEGRTKRNHVATSIISDNLHFLIDAGSPCVETMIDNNAKIPDILFLTHSHTDHVSDLDKLANSRKRGIKYDNKINDQKRDTTFPVICTKECLEHPQFGLKKQFDYLQLKWIPIPSYDVWYSITKEEQRLIPTSMLSDKCEGKVFEIDFKALTVYHGTYAPGACLYIFRIGHTPESKRIVMSGDFESIEDSIIKNPDLNNPDFLLLETNTIYATGTNHTNWQQNKKLLETWITGEKNVCVVLNHLSGYEDWEQRYFTEIPDDNKWQEIIKEIEIPKATIRIAEDGNSYDI